MRKVNVISQKNMSDESVLYFLAESSDANDSSMLIQGIEALATLGENYEEYLTEICEAAKSEIVPYFIGGTTAIEDLPPGLSLTWIETRPGETILTLKDTAGIIGSMSSMFIMM